MTRRAAVAGAALLACLLRSPARAGADGPACAGYIEVDAAQATFYTPGTLDACELPVAPGEHIAAVSTPDFDGSAPCGRCLAVTGPLGTVLVRVVEECPTCGAGNLDLDPDAFAQIADPSDGIAAVSYTSTECPVTGPIELYVSEQSNDFYAQVQIRNHRYGVASVEAYSGGGWVVLPRSTDNYFVFSGSVPDPLVLRVADIHGDVLTEPGIPFSPGSLQAGTGQFAPCPEPRDAAGAVAVLSMALARRRVQAGVAR